MPWIDGTSDQSSSSSQLGMKEQSDYPSMEEQGGMIR